MGEGCGGSIGREEGSGRNEERGDGEHGEGFFPSYLDEIFFC